ncbi:MAG: outer membrane protein assembly factor BamD [Bacteroidetes bacterium]|nr:outer membrane protein assembly factor BamD [Bacteroidota bacterium]
MKNISKTSQPKMHSISSYLYCIVTLILISSCGSSVVVDYRDPESVFKAGVSALNDNDYIEAQKMFDIVRLQFSTTQFADDAQYYLGELNFKRRDFIIAAFNYNMLLRSYPTSDYVKRALYKSALCYDELSPPSDRDQEYTKKAIQAFSEFQAVYAQDSLSNEATKHIVSLRQKLAEREYNTAVIYRKLYSWKATLIYYDTLMEEYSDTEFYEPAFLGKIEMLAQLKRYEDAKALIGVYKHKFPNGKYLTDISSIETNFPSK